MNIDIIRYDFGDIFFGTAQGGHIVTSIGRSIMTDDVKHRRKSCKQLKASIKAWETATNNVYQQITQSRDTELDAARKELINGIHKNVNLAETLDSRLDIGSWKKNEIIYTREDANEPPPIQKTKSSRKADPAYDFLLLELFSHGSNATPIGREEGYKAAKLYKGNFPKPRFNTKIYKWIKGETKSAYLDEIADFDIRVTEEGLKHLAGLKRRFANQQDVTKQISNIVNQFIAK